MKYLIVVDMQNDFINGSLGSEAAQAIVPAVAAKIEEYRKDAFAKIIFTHDTHSNDYLETFEGKNLPVVHCVEGTNGWEIHTDLKSDNSSDFHFYKNTFGFLDWTDYLNISDTDEIEIIGLCTDICVVSNALILRAIFPNVRIICDSSCCAGTSEEAHNAALTVMKSCQITVI